MLESSHLKDGWVAQPAGTELSESPLRPWNLLRNLAKTQQQIDQCSEMYIYIYIYDFGILWGISKTNRFHEKFIEICQIG